VTSRGEVVFGEEQWRVVISAEWKAWGCVGSECDEGVRPLWCISPLCEEQLRMVLSAECMAWGCAGPTGSPKRRRGQTPLMHFAALGCSSTF